MHDSPIPDAGHLTRDMYREILNFVPGVVYIFNLATHENDYSNKSTGDLIGYSAEEIKELGDRFLPSVMHPDDLPTVMENFAKFSALADDQVADIQYRMRHRDGRWIWIRSIDRVYERDAQGNVTRLIGVATDVTTARKTEQALAEQNEILTNINAEIEDMVYVANHDVIAPLRNISTLIGFLEDDLEQGVRNHDETLSRMREMVDTARGKINKILEVARARHSDTVERTYCDFAQTAADVLSVLDDEIQRTDARIKLDFSSAAGVTYAQPLVQSVFENLISNAIKYAKPGLPPRIGHRVPYLSFRISRGQQLSNTCLYMVVIH